MKELKLEGRIFICNGCPCALHGICQSVTGYKFKNTYKEQFGISIEQAIGEKENEKRKEIKF
jgi:hypothetical protein